jgi:hypothetical protein
MVRSVLALVLGLVVAVAVTAALEWIGLAVFPLPEGVNPSDPEALKKLLPTMPAGRFLLLLADYAAAGLAGGFVAAWVARRRPALHALIVGAVLTVLGFLNLLMLPGHPAWFWAANAVVYLLPAYAGARLAPRAGSVSDGQSVAHASGS